MSDFTRVIYTSAFVRTFNDGPLGDCCLPAYSLHCLCVIGPGDTMRFTTSASSELQRLTSDNNRRAARADTTAVVLRPNSLEVCINFLWQPLRHCEAAVPLC